MERRDGVVLVGGKVEEHELLKLGGVGVGWIKVGEDAVAAGEFSGGHESAGEEILLLDFGDVEEDGEALAVEQNDDVRVGRNERTGWHVGFENRGPVLLDPGLEVFVLALVVEVVNSVLEGSNEGKPRWWGN